MNDMTRDELLAGAHRAMVEAALSLTRLSRPMRRAVRLVLLDKKRQTEAATAVGRDRRHVHRALLRVRPKLAVIEAYVHRKSTPEEER